MDTYKEGHTEAGYTCPYCRWNKSHTWTELRPEEKLLNRKVIAENYDSTLYLDTKQKYRVRICRRCSRALKIRDYVLLISLLLILCSFVVGMALQFVYKLTDNPIIGTYSHYAIAAMTGVALFAGAFWLLWKIAHRTRVHVTFDKASQCNAIEPFKS